MCRAFASQRTRSDRLTFVDHADRVRAQFQLLIRIPLIPSATDDQHFVITMIMLPNVIYIYNLIFDFSLSPRLLVQEALLCENSRNARLGFPLFLLSANQCTLCWSTTAIIRMILP